MQEDILRRRVREAADALPYEDILTELAEHARVRVKEWGVLQARLDTPLTVSRRDEIERLRAALENCAHLLRTIRRESNEERIGRQPERVRLTNVLDK